MQNARNCLEHRNGIVGRIDARTDGALELRFPRMKFFVLQEGEEVELYRNFYVEKETEIKLRLDVRIRTFRVGERLLLKAEDFDEIAFACSHFGSEVAKRLPKA